MGGKQRQGFADQLEKLALSGGGGGGGGGSNAKRILLFSLCLAHQIQNFQQAWNQKLSLISLSRTVGPTTWKFVYII